MSLVYRITKSSVSAAGAAGVAVVAGVVPAVVVAGCSLQANRETHIITARNTAMSLRMGITSFYIMLNNIIIIYSKNKYKFGKNMHKLRG